MVADTKLYNALGVSPDASQDDIKKAYRKMALKWHPDKHPAEDRANAEKKFKEVSAAYDILSNEQKKKIYDMYGEKGLQAGGGEPGENPFGGAGGPTFVFREGTPGTHFQWTNEGPQGDAFRMFEQFFGGRNPFAFSSDDDFGGGFGSFGGFPFGGMGGRMGGGGGGLEEIFKMQSGFGQQGQRSKPKAKGNPQQVDLNCSLEDIYKGATKKMKVTRKRVRDGRVYDEPKVIEIKLKPGWKEGTKITFEGDGDQAVGGTPSDLVFVVKEKKHELFLREGDDLVYHAQIARNQTREPHIIPFLDGSELKVHDGLRSIANDQQIRISGKGMPNSKTGKYGDLVVTFHLI